MYISTVESNVLCVLSTTKENVKKGRITYLTVPILDKLNISKSEQSLKGILDLTKPLLAQAHSFIM